MHDLPPRWSSDIAEAHLVVRKYLYWVYVGYDRCGNANDDKLWGEVDWIIHVDAACFCVSCFSPVFPSTFRRETVMCNVSTYKSMRDTWMWHLPTYFESFNAVPLSTRRHSCLLVRTPGHRSWGCWFDDGRSGFPVFSSVKREIYLGILFLKIFLLFSFFCYSWNVKVAKR